MSHHCTKKQTCFKKVQKLKKIWLRRGLNPQLSCLSTWNVLLANLAVKIQWIFNENSSLRMKITWKNKSLYFQWDSQPGAMQWKPFEFIQIYNTPWKCHENHWKSISELNTLWKCYQIRIVTLWKCYEFCYQCSYVYITTYDVYLDTLS